MQIGYGWLKNNSHNAYTRTHTELYKYNTYMCVSEEAEIILKVQTPPPQKKVTGLHTFGKNYEWGKVKLLPNKVIYSIYSGDKLTIYISFKPDVHKCKHAVKANTTFKIQPCSAWPKRASSSGFSSAFSFNMWNRSWFWVALVISVCFKRPSRTLICASLWAAWRLCVQSSENKH